jgi:hypothetical protein
MKLFRELAPDEEAQFRQWARYHYEPFTKIEGIWHPVVQDECVKMNIEEAAKLHIPVTDLYPEHLNKKEGA